MNKIEFLETTVKSVFVFVLFFVCFFGLCVNCGWNNSVSGNHANCGFNTKSKHNQFCTKIWKKPKHKKKCEQKRKLVEILERRDAELKMLRRKNQEYEQRMTYYQARVNDLEIWDCIIQSQRNVKEQGTQTETDVSLCSVNKYK